ncbi:MAG TPA: Spy/CpxP family protein refolding chaperone [Verrucomicrobiae bacterium]|jgi:hypothetical protein|nr:Spy/CpxP family protein refolding chaperone [Verrucomicrobiae bacterium]
MKIRLIVILAVAILGCSERSFGYTPQPADVRSQGPADPAASARNITEPTPAASRPSPDSGTVIVEFQFPAPEIDSELAEYLNLTSRQIIAMRHVLSQQRREIDPLKTQLQSTHGKLIAAAEQGQSKEIKVLAATEARILTKLITKSLRAQAKLHGLLTEEQQKKLEDLNRSR